MSVIRVYDPAMCCATGVCGPSVDPELTRVATAIFLLEKKDIDIKRFNLGSEPQAFIDEAKVQELLNTKGTEALPAILVNGEVKLEGRYPTNEEFAKWAGIFVSELTKKKTKPKGIELL
ncbi:arsenite efflux transporter metallochaperone ArsD [Alkalihalobacillus sp. MEB130]|uniref:arsenite efflux transporter metallochaperone ArsD n=1 Tax=Alkalihalobacillus sp. MEB130 TaxID=2976704 RepID=UPI0028DFF2F6|nr:arsenite efflux transporter metallochaperone ArsD [Alkalihalobacillus sp. MEB130]MDT8859544.1 arsenite efflux transporter metallochaperone ArsD [Alkalihalobacillus sp. MEB130]